MQIGCCPISRSPIRRHRERRVPKHAALEIAQPNPAPPARARPAPQAHPARPQLPPKSNYKKMRLLISYHSLPVKNWPSDTRASRMGETTCGRPAGQAEIAAAQFTKRRGHKPHDVGATMRLECSGHGQNHISRCGGNGYGFEVSDRNRQQTFAGGLRPVSGLERTAAKKLESAHGGSRND